MALQERPYWKKEDDDDEPDTRPVNQSYGPYGEPPRVERPASEPAVEIRHPVPAAPALEGIISWRQNEDMVHKAKSEHSREKEDDDEEDEDGQPARPASTKTVTSKPVQPVEHKEPAEQRTDAPEVTADDLILPPEHTLVAEQAQHIPEGVVVEAQSRQEKAKDDEDDAEDTDGTPQPHTARLSSRPTTPAPAKPAGDTRGAIYPPAKDFEPLVSAAPYGNETPPAEATSVTPARFQTAGGEQSAPQPVSAAFEASAPAVADTELGPAAPAQEAEPFSMDLSDTDVPPPHVGTTEAADFQPASPNVPPVEVGDIPPPPPRNPASYAYQQAPGMYPPAYAQQPAAAVAAPRFEQAPVENHRHGEPLAAAVGLGLVAEHIGRKRADTRQQNQIDRFTEQTAQYQQENNAQYARMQEQQRRFANEQQRQTDEMQRMQLQQQSQQERYATSPATPYNLEYAPEPARQTPNTQPAAPVGQPNTPRAFEAPAGNPLHRQYGAEGRPQTRLQGQEAARPMPGQPGNTERQPDQQTEQDYQNEFQPQPKQHVEQSAWHRIVTEHGHEVPGAVQYGQEFHRQREHELLTDQSTANPTPGGAGAAGIEGAPAGQQFPGQPMPGMSYQQPGHPGALPSGMTNPTLPPGHPTHIDPQHQLPPAPSKQVASNIANPWFWIMLALIVGAFFTAALI